MPGEIHRELIAAFALPVDIGHRHYHRRAVGVGQSAAESKAQLIVDFVYKQCYAVAKQAFPADVVGGRIDAHTQCGYHAPSPGERSNVGQRDACIQYLMRIEHCRSFAVVQSGIVGVYPYAPC